MTDFQSLTKDYARESVPDGQTRSVIKLLAVFVGFTVNIAALILGAQIGSGAPFLTGLLGCIIGGFLLFVIGGITAMIGAQTRLSTGMICKLSFGHKGANVIAFILALSLFGWFGIQTEIFAASLHELLNAAFNINIPRIALVLFGGVLMSSTAIIGFKALEKLSLISVPLLFLLLLWPLVTLLVTDGASNFFAAQNDPALLATQTLSLQMIISLVAGSSMVVAVLMPDIMRYARTRRDGVLTAYFGFAVIYPVMLVLSMILTILARQIDIVAIMMQLGLGIPALLIIILATWTTNDSNLYSSSLNLSAIFTHVRKWKLAAATGVIGTVLAAWGILGHFIGWLTLLGLVIAPVGGVIIADYMMNAKTYHSDRLDSAPSVHWSHLGTLLIGIIGGVCSTGTAGQAGLFTLTTIPPLDGLLIAAAATALCSYIARRRAASKSSA